MLSIDSIQRSKPIRTISRTIITAFSSKKTKDQPQQDVWTSKKQKPKDWKEVEVPPKQVNRFNKYL